MPAPGRSPRASLLVASALALVLALPLAAGSGIEAEFAAARDEATRALGRLDVPAAIAAQQRMHSLARQHERGDWQARAIYQEGMLARRQGRNEDALRLLEESLVLARRHGDRAGEIQSLNDYSVMQRRAGNLYQALDGHTRALELARELEQPELVAESLAKIGRIYGELDDLEPALDFYRQAIAAARPEDLRQLAELESDVAIVCLRLGRQDEARASVERLSALAGRSGEPDLLALAYGRQARLLQVAGQPAQALPLIERAIELGKPVDGARSVLVRQMMRVRVLMDLERWDEAAQAISPLLEEARRTGDLLNERNLLDLHGEILMGVGDPAGAYAAARDYHRIQEGLATTMTSRRIADLEASMRRRQIEADLKLLERQGQLQKLAADRQHLLAITLATLLALLLVAAFALVGRYRGVRRLNAALVDSHRQLEIAARTDALTGLGNRLATPDAHSMSVQAQARGELCGLILVDVDHFKRINDEHGHLVGDQVLQSVARSLRLALPAGMQLVRWGGEEFLAFGSFRDRESALAVAESLRRAVRAHPPREAGQALVPGLSISLGVSLADGPMQGWDALIRQADDALYAAKDGGRNRVCFGGAAA